MTFNAQQNHRANTGTGRMNRFIQVNSFSHKYIVRANIKMSMKRYVTLKGMQQSLVCTCLNVLWGCTIYYYIIEHVFIVYSKIYGLQSSSSCQGFGVLSNKF